MNSNFLDRWERDDADSLAPLSTNQQKFIDRLIDLIKVFFGLKFNILAR